MGGDHIAKDEDLDLTEMRERETVQFVLLSIRTNRQIHTSDGLFVSLMCEHASMHCTHIYWLYCIY